MSAPRESPFAAAVKQLAEVFRPVSAALGASPMLGPFWRAAVAAEEAKQRARRRVHDVAPDLYPIFNQAIEDRDVDTVRRITRHVDRLVEGRR